MQMNQYNTQSNVTKMTTSFSSVKKIEIHNVYEVKWITIFLTKYYCNEVNNLHNAYIQQWNTTTNKKIK